MTDIFNVKIPTLIDLLEEDYALEIDGTFIRHINLDTDAVAGEIYIEADPYYFSREEVEGAQYEPEHGHFVIKENDDREYEVSIHKVTKYKPFDPLRKYLLNCVVFLEVENDGRDEVELRTVNMGAINATLNNQESLLEVKSGADFIELLTEQISNETGHSVQSLNVDATTVMELLK